MNWETIIVALIVAVPPTIVAIRTHRAVNSRMDKLLKIAIENATFIEKEAEKLRQKVDRKSKVKK